MAAAAAEDLKEKAPAGLVRNDEGGATREEVVEPAKDGRSVDEEGSAEPKPEARPEQKPLPKPEVMSEKKPPLPGPAPKQEPRREPKPEPEPEPTKANSETPGDKPQYALEVNESQPGLKLSAATVYDIKMTTSFAVPVNGAPINQLRVYHALPTVRSWMEADSLFGATGLKASPKEGTRSYDKSHDAHFILWTSAGPLTPGSKYTFTTEYKTTSYTREFAPDVVKVTWKDYAKPSKDPVAVPNAAVAKNVHPDLAKVSDALKEKYAPPPAVLEMCKWV
jgi:outer membrane biosynthesis protein TonB